jgi:nitroreductase
MEAMEAILSRRSIRKYTGEPVGEDLVKRMLEAAMAAPSAGNQQCWQYVVITDREILNQIPSIHPNATMVSDAALHPLRTCSWQHTRWVWVPVGSEFTRARTESKVSGSCSGSRKS